MAEASPKTIPKLRTFAQDVERARQKSGLVTPTENKVGETPKLGAVKSDVVNVSSTAAPKPTGTDEAHIPAFHELQKKSPQPVKGPSISVSAPTPKATPAPKRTVSVRAKKQDLKATKNVGGGTVITDSKTGGFKLIPSIISSIDNWIKDIKRSFKKKTEPKYVITDTERRRGVIQKATSKTGSIFTADNETLREQIRRRQQQAPDKEPDISWSPNTEAGYPLLESGAPKTVTSNVTVEFKKQTTPQPAPTPVAPKQAIPEKTIVPPPVFVEPTNTTPVEPEPAPKISDAVEETPIPEEEVIELAEETTPVESAEEYELTTPEAHYKIRSLGDIAKMNTNMLSIGIVGAIAGLIILIVVLRALLGFILPDSATVTVPPATPLTSVAEATDTTIETLSPGGVITALQQNSYPALTELRFVDTEGTPISTESILPLLGFTKHPNLNRSISDVRIVARGQERALVFTVTDTTTAFGSLLSWENTLPTDVAAVLGINTIGLTGGFSDITIGTTDVRVFKTDSLEERLVYGFIDENTIVITNTTTFFTTLLGSN